jgi:hypothetical protein
MYQIARIYSASPNYEIVVGPLISAGDAITPYTGLSSVDSLKVFDPYGNSTELSAIVPASLTDITNGYYLLEIDPTSNAISANGSFKISIQAAGEILPFNMDLMVLHPDTYDELVNGPAGSNTEITQILQQVSGTSNISTHLSAVEVKINTANSAITNGFASTDVNIQGVSALALMIKSDTEDILYDVSRIGSISADTISGDELHKAGATIKDIEVRDNEVFVTYRDPDDGKLKTFSQAFHQDIIIASGGDLGVISEPMV